MNSVFTPKNGWPSDPTSGATQPVRDLEHTLELSRDGSDNTRFSSGTKKVCYRSSKPRHSFNQDLTEAGTERQPHTLGQSTDLSVKSALISSRLVLVNKALSRHMIKNWHSFLVGSSCCGMVSTSNGSENSLNHCAHHGTLARIEPRTVLWKIKQ